MFTEWINVLTKEQTKREMVHGNSPQGSERGLPGSKSGLTQQRNLWAGPQSDTIWFSNSYHKSSIVTILTIPPFYEGANQYSETLLNRQGSQDPGLCQDWTWPTAQSPPPWPVSMAPSAHSQLVTGDVWQRLILLLRGSGLLSGQPRGARFLPRVTLLSVIITRQKQNCPWHMQALEGSAQKSWEQVTLEGGNEPCGLSLRVGYSGASADSITT